MQQRHRERGRIVSARIAISLLFIILYFLLAEAWIDETKFLSLGLVAKEECECSLAQMVDLK